jgi:hypothetical protein
MRAFLRHDPVGASPLRIAFFRVAIKGRTNGSHYDIRGFQHWDLHSLTAKAIATTNGLIYVKLTAFAACHRASMAYAARRSDKPARSAARGSGQIVCQVRGCRPVEKGRRVEIVGAFNEEACN